MDESEIQRRLAIAAEVSKGLFSGSALSSGANAAEFEATIASNHLLRGPGTAYPLPAIDGHDGQLLAFLQTAGVPSARHSPDFRSVHWFGTDYGFTKNQALCVKLLWVAWKNGTPERDGLAVVTEADVSQTRFVDVFKRQGTMHSAWGAMIVPGSTKGVYRLAEPQT